MKLKLSEMASVAEIIGAFAIIYDKALRGVSLSGVDLMRYVAILEFDLMKPPLPR